MFDKSQVLNVLSQLFFGMLGALILQLAFIHHSEKIAMVNITGMVDSFIKETAKQPLSPQEMKQKINRFGVILDSTLQTLSRNRHLVLLPSEAVVSGAPDVTNEVFDKIKEGLKK